MFVRQTLAISMLEQNDKQKWREAEAELGGALSEVANRLDLPVVMLLRHYLALARLRLGRVREAADDLTRLLADRERVLGDTIRRPNERRNSWPVPEKYWTILPKASLRAHGKL